MNPPTNDQNAISRRTMLRKSAAGAGIGAAALAAPSITGLSVVPSMAAAMSCEPVTGSTTLVVTTGGSTVTTIPVTIAPFLVANQPSSCFTQILVPPTTLLTSSLSMTLVASNGAMLSTIAGAFNFSSAMGRSITAPVACNAPFTIGTTTATAPDGTVYTFTATDIVLATACPAP